MSFTREEYEKVVRALCHPIDADDIMACYDTGWSGFADLSPDVPVISLGLAAVSPAYAQDLLGYRPDLADQVREMQRDPDQALADLRQKYGWREED